MATVTQTKSLASIFEKKDNLSKQQHHHNNQTTAKYGSFINLAVPDKKSLTSFVESIRKEITKKATEKVIDRDKQINIFTQKFSKSFVEWNELMNLMSKKITIIDKKYMVLNYFGLKEKLAHHLLNISLSFVMIGGQTVSDKIKIFFELLEPTMNKISLETKVLLELDRSHSLFLTKINNITYLIQTLKKNPVDQSSIEPIIKEKQMLENNIINIINEKKQCYEKIRLSFCSLENCLQFDYFLHDDWCPYLDIDIIKKFKN